MGPKFPFFLKCLKGNTIGQTGFSNNGECKCENLNDECHYPKANQRLGFTNENSMCCKSEEQCNSVKNEKTSVPSFESKERNTIEENEEIEETTTQTNNNFLSGFNWLQSFFSFTTNSQSPSVNSVDSRTSSQSSSVNSVNSQNSNNNKNNWFFNTNSRNKVRNYISRRNNRGK